MDKGTNEGDRQKVAIVTGSSSGVGYATSLILARNGFCNINKTASLESIANAEKLPLKLIQLDVTDDSSVKDAKEKVVLEKGRINALVNNAGYALFGAFGRRFKDWVKSQNWDDIRQQLTSGGIMRAFYLGINRIIHFDVKFVLCFINQLPNESS